MITSSSLKQNPVIGQPPAGFDEELRKLLRGIPDPLSAGGVAPAQNPGDKSLLVLAHVSKSGEPDQLLAPIDQSVVQPGELFLIHVFPLFILT